MNLQHLSREELVAMMLGHPAPTAGPPYACDGAGHAVRTPAHSASSDPLRERLAVARELILRDLKAQMAKGPVMSSPQDLKDWLRLYCAGLQHEVFLVIYLDATHRLIAEKMLFRGSLTQASVYPREVVKGALRHNAAAIAVAHNHPSGQAEPSRADEFLTQTLRSKCQACHFALNDKESVMRSTGL